MNLAEQIIASHAGRDAVCPGEILSVTVDRVYVQDGNSPTIAKIFAKYGFEEVFAREKIGVFFDHSVLPPNIGIADRLVTGGAVVSAVAVPPTRVTAVSC